MAVNCCNNASLLRVNRTPIARKPVPGSSVSKEKSTQPIANYEHYGFLEKHLFEEYRAEASDLSLDNLSEDELNADDHDNARKEGIQGNPAVPCNTQFGTRQGTSSPSARWKTAYNATKHFAGGLITHPVQSTKHFSILQHSHGLVIYKGASTNVAITVFADDVHDNTARTFWLQQKGWSGSWGMRLKTALGNNASWLEVTPQACVQASHIKLENEKAWQRDIARFLRKASDDKRFRHRRLVETCIIRILFASQDGYFRLTMATEGGKKVLCPSPVFRVASFGIDSASFKGASLSTMPLEIGIKAFTIFATKAASAGAAPVIGAIQNRFGHHMPSVVTRQVAKSAYSSLDLQKHSDHGNKRNENTCDRVLAQIDAGEHLAVVGEDSGPAAPYPVRFTGTVVQGEGRSNVETGLPTASIAGIRAELKSRLDGIYFGWAAIRNSETIGSEKWRKALIFARPAPGVVSVSPKKKIQTYILEDFTGADFYDAELSVIIMGFLRPWLAQDTISFAQETMLDIAIANQSLDREGWDAEATFAHERLNTRLSDRCINAMQFGQRQVDRLPFDKLAIRATGAESHDNMLGKVDCI